MGTDDNVLIGRLDEASRRIVQDPTLSLEVQEGGIVCKKVWKISSLGIFYKLENFTPWKAIIYAEVNPLMAAFTSLSKQAGTLQ